MNVDRPRHRRVTRAIKAESAIKEIAATAGFEEVVEMGLLAFGRRDIDSDRLETAFTGRCHRFFLCRAVRTALTWGGGKQQAQGQGWQEPSFLPGE